MSDRYEIKPLVFKGDGFKVANTAFGSYDISTKAYLKDLFGEDEGYEDHEFKHKLKYCFDEYYDEGEIGEFDTLKEAKFAANKHWVERVSKDLRKLK